MELLKILSETNGVSGDEGYIAEIISDIAKKYCSEVFLDNMDNLYCLKKGTSESKKTIMLCAHTDEVGIIISSITDEGFLKFRTVGGIDESILLAKRVLIGKNKVLGVTGIKPVHLCSEDDMKKKPSAEEMYIDIGVDTKEEALKLVSVGDYGTFDTDFEQLGALLKGKAFDDRLGCYIMLKLMEKDFYHDIWYCFNVQEEIGLRGASVSSRRIKADYGVVLECTTCLDMPQVKESEISTRVRKGPALTIVDGYGYTDKDLREILASCGKHQYKNVPRGGNDAGALKLNNIKVAAVSIPARYIHSPLSVVSGEDVKNCILMLENFLDKEDL